MRVTRRGAIAGLGAGAGAIWLALADEAFAQQANPGIPVALDDNAHIIFPITLRGEAARALLDNGASVTLLDRGYAEAHDLKSGRTRKLNGVETSESVRIDLAMGSYRGAVSPPILDLAGFAAATGESIELIVGRDVLMTMIVGIDFDAKRLRITPWRQDFPVPSGWVLVPLASVQANDAPITCEIEIEGRKVRAFVDLGSSLPLMIRDGPLVQDWFDKGRRWTTAYSGVARGGDVAFGSTRVTRAERVKLGAWEMKDIPVQVYPPDGSPFSRYEAVIGAALLGCFHLSLDTRGGRLWLAPNSTFANPFRFGLVGAGAIPEGDRLRIVHVSANSPAEKAGLKDGDLIVAINDRAPPDRKQITEAALGTRLAIRLSDDKVKDVVAAEFY